MAVCVYAGVGLLLMVHIPVVGGFLGEVLHGMLYLLIRGVGWMADWPGAVIRIRFDMLDVCLMYLALGLVGTYLMHGGIRKLQAGLGTILLLLLFDVVGKYAVVVNV